MLGIVSKERIDPFYFQEFKKLARTGRVKLGAQEGHLDGWGIAGYSWGKASPRTFAQNSRVTCDSDKCTVQESSRAKVRGKYFARSAKSVLVENERYEGIVKKLENLSPKIVIVHFRKASAGSISLENTHPFKKNDWLFCHNGTIFEAEKLPLWHYEVVGTNDSEYFFKFLLERIDSLGKEKIIQVVKEITNYIREKHNYTSLTFLLTNGKTFFAYREFNPDYSDEEETREDTKRYYTLYYTQDKETTLICSEKIARFNWKPLQNGELLVVNDQV